MRQLRARFGPARAQTLDTFIRSSVRLTAVSTSTPPAR
jgi:hypothetical protein